MSKNKHTPDPAREGSNAWELFTQALTTAAYNGLNYISAVSHTVAYRLGWTEDSGGTRGFVASAHQGISEYYTLMENLTDQEHARLEKNWKGWEVDPRTKKPYGPAIALAGTLLNIADHFAAMHWDLGGAVLAQLKYKAQEADAMLAVKEYRHPSGGSLVVKTFKGSARR